MIARSPRCRSILPRSASTACIGNRKTHSFGWRYDFDDASFTPAEPIPDWLQPLREKAAGFADVQPSDFVHVLLARYDPGAGIGWHRDRDVFEKVVGISLGTPATLRFRQRTATGFRRASVDVEPRSAYLLSGESALELGAQHRARRPAALLNHLPDVVRQRPAHRGQGLIGTVRERNGFCAHALGVGIRGNPGGLLQGPGRGPTINRASAFARCRMGARQ